MTTEAQGLAPRRPWGCRLGEKEERGTEKGRMGGQQGAALQVSGGRVGPLAGGHGHGRLGARGACGQPGT